MSQTTLTALSAAAPLAAGWSVHTLWLRRRIEAARRDPLTGLHTRDGFTARAVRIVRSGPAVVLLADVNDFKTSNDRYGHAAGDAVLAAVAGRLARSCRSGAVGRLGGDEFAAVLPVPPYAARLAVSRLHGPLCQPLETEGRRLSVSVSLGAATVEPDPLVAAADVLAYGLRLADEAMYAAKRTDGRWHLAAAGPAHPTVNGRRAGRPGTHPIEEGTRS